MKEKISNPIFAAVLRFNFIRFLGAFKVGLFDRSMN